MSHSGQSVDMIVNPADSQPPPLKTIEGTIFKALVTAGAVSQDNADDPVKASRPMS